MGIVSLMYHRFNENQYPSTNIKIDVFKKQIEQINNKKINFVIPSNFDKNFNFKKERKQILLTIDDAFSSFYENAWPILKKEKIPFILFVSTQPVGKYGYMTWEQIKEVEKEDFAFIGNHSHSHEYLVEYNFNEFKKDIDTSIRIFNNNIGYNPIFFSYPFGEFSLEQKKYISSKFKYGFGQNSGVIDLNKDKYELPRFPINEKYGEIKRFKRLLKTIPFPFKKIYPDEKYLNNKNNPPDVKIIFYEDGPDLKNISCYSNEQDRWRKSKIELPSKNELKIILDGKFTTERGRINCSLRENNGNWRWLGIQFVISDL